MSTTDDHDPARDELRQRILGQLGEPMTLTDLADRLEVTDARLLWHLRRLRSADYVAADEAEAGWRRTVAGAAATGRSAPTSPRRAFPERIVADFEQAIVESREGIYGNDFVQHGGEHRSRLSREQAAEFRDRLVKLVEEYFAPGSGDRGGLKYGFHWVLTPIDLHPLRDDQDTS